MVSDDKSHERTRDEFMVRGDHVPRRPFRACCAHGVLVGFHVIVPEPALADVGSRKFPVFLRIFEALDEALFLLA